MNKNAAEYVSRLIPDDFDRIEKTDPEFADFFGNFAFDEVVRQGSLDEKTRFMAILAALLGCQGKEEFAIMAGGALRAGVTPVEIREIVYQAVAYLGIGRVYPFFKAMNKTFKKNGIALPLPNESTTTPEDRQEKGTQTQVVIFGPNMKDFYQSGPEESRHINYWLADNCFGDYYTRKGLDNRQREMLTFCYILAQGGCEPQLKSHAAANMKIGNSKQFLIDVISQVLPYIGYPRSLNALACVNQAAESMEQQK